MSTGYTKPKKQELQNDIIAIAEIPERITEFSKVRLKEILEYLQSEFEYRLKMADATASANFEKYKYPNEYLPDKELEYWLERTYQFGFNYYDLKHFQEVIKSHLNSNTEKEISKDQEQPEIISQVFKPGGFEVFNYLDEHFTTFNNRPPTKYTILFHFLEGKKAYPNKTKFIEFVRSHCSNQLNGKKFSKIESDYKSDPHFIDSEPKLTSLYNTYLETSKS